MFWSSLTIVWTNHRFIRWSLIKFKGFTYQLRKMDLEQIFLGCNYMRDKYVGRYHSRNWLESFLFDSYMPLYQVILLQLFKIPINILDLPLWARPMWSHLWCYNWFKAIMLPPLFFNCVKNSRSFGFCFSSLVLIAFLLQVRYIDFSCLFPLRKRALTITSRWLNKQ